VDAVIAGLLFMLVLFAMFYVLRSPHCPFCGKQFQHADDCPQRRV
jgi:hypothetical protein